MPRELLDLLPLLISWVLWKARNLLIFEGRELPVSAVIREVQQTLYDIYSVRELRAFSNQLLLLQTFGFSRVLRQKWIIQTHFWHRQS